eukprot:TRINITY_DN16712_c1_g1_i1.p2 TRINITY_DN16712_c1_g1~~TRINITY_DN16712_c1_g1_i1.p2  ORF type:complete len:261 (-),score=22.29 TRINITY_DN16712_c1_g1_i1:288-1070(-)
MSQFFYGIHKHDFGQWKLLQYTIREVFAPLYVFGEVSEDKKELQVYAVSDVNLTLEAEIKIQVIRYKDTWDDSAPKPTILAATLQPQDVYSYTMELEALLNTVSVQDPEDAYIHLDISVKNINSSLQQQIEHVGLSSSQLSSSSDVWLAPLKDVDLGDAGFFIGDAYYDSTDGTVKIEFYSNTIAPFVYINTKYKGVFSKMGFTQTPFESIWVAFTPWENVKVEDLLSSLQIFCMNSVNNYNNIPTNSRESQFSPKMREK